MSGARVIVVLVLVSLALAQSVLLPGFQDIRSIDIFEKDTQNIVISIPENPSFPIVEERTVTGDGSDLIFGNERNLRLTVTSGSADSVVVSGVSASEFNSATPGQASAVAMLQYDGADGTADLDPAGLRSVNGLNTDLTSGGAYAIHAVMETDIITDVIFRVYSGSSTNFCQFVQILPGDDTLHDYILPFEEFELIGSGCEFTNIGAIEIIAEMFENVDILIETLFTYGPIPVTPTPSPTKTPSPSPLITPSSSRTPTPTPSPPPGCICRCPVFVCEVFRVDDAYNFYILDNFFGTFFSRFFFFFTDPSFFTPQFFSFFSRFFDIWYGYFDF